MTYWRLDVIKTRRKKAKARKPVARAKAKSPKRSPKKESKPVKAVKVPAVKVSTLAKESEGFALIHKKDRTISIASMRSNKLMVEQLASAFKVNGAYRIGRVLVREIAP